jgi:hypothetical protein
MWDLFRQTEIPDDGILQSLEPARKPALSVVQMISMT